MKNIVIVVLNDYYLFDYLADIVKSLRGRGMKVTLLYADPKVKEKYLKAFADDINYLPLPRIIRILNNFGGKFIFRIALWVVANAWIKSLKRTFDFAITPGDNKPIWHLFCTNFPSICNDVVTNFIDIDTRLVAETYKGKNIKTHRFFLILDWIFCKKFLPRANGIVLRYVPIQLLVDRLMGDTRPNFMPNFGYSTFITVTGHRIKENLARLGVDERKILVTGHPGYDELITFAQKNGTKEAKALLKEELGLKTSKKIVTMFLSPSAFNQSQIDELDIVFKTLSRCLPQVLLIIKFHPKTAKGEDEKVTNVARSYGIEIHVLTEFLGDLHNLKLMLVSEFLLQKQCTLGFLAMNADTPMVSYNLIDGGYEDDMYDKMGASKHAAFPEELENILISMQDEKFKEQIIQGYKQRRDLYCLHTTRASQDIVEIIENS